MRISFLLLMLWSFGSQAQNNLLFCKANEEVVFSFQLKNKKRVFVCKEKKNAYLVYRYGSSKKIELQYPENPDSSSWKKFTLQAYSRGGGVQNAAMEFAFLSFYNKDAEYEVYEHWEAESNQATCGIRVTTGNYTTDMRGLLASRKGYLYKLTETAVQKPE